MLPCLHKTCLYKIDKLPLKIPVMHKSEQQIKQFVFLFKHRFTLLVVDFVCTPIMSSGQVSSVQANKAEIHPERPPTVPATTADQAGVCYSVAAIVVQKCSLSHRP